MKIRTFLTLAAFFLVITLNAQIKHATTVVVKVKGSCEMCTARIEKAGSFKKISKTKYSLENQEATITFDSTQTNLNIILQKIAEVGHDNEMYSATDEVYENLPNCCHYARKEE
jgi:outer membrane receptor for ferrienterochelin and colicins